ncbi:hypothetical protein BS50DRAFT_591005 [Corynespora cassiicola Philippines]|uniref:Uncharacterized protein n=1 Tax=Corynespora cassiicola Philippines TaxID=1448308 RepID=A0A2T2NF13_CORCC|nr:hypothetical protein BS50DRAFT_591005 [Corynespora cassiicola Philippines]
MELFARINGCGLGPRYDDDASMYHPYDFVIAKHFPEVDIPSLRCPDWIRYIYRASLREEIPEMIPKTWRNPPPRPPEELQPAVEGYRSRLLAKIESRIKQYSYEPSTAPKIHKITLSGSPGLSSSAGDVAEHPALQIPEILWTILEFGTAETHPAAFYTS